ncbi:MFS transporter [Microbacterium sp. STN6]|uniref:MFS transporter n=1 Tax=Microbacterium sp. STN6 TaxID=2995588 RepID=UPI003A599692
MPVLSARPPWRETLVALRVPNYRLFASSNLVQNTAGWMQRIAMDWLVLELTGSATAVGITVFMQFLPMLCLGLFGGVIADRFPKRNLLIGTQSTAVLLAAALAVLTLTGMIAVWQIWIIALLQGMATVVDNPARQVFVNELVGPRYLRNAISINSSIFQLGGLLGPAVGGVLITLVGAGWLFAINAVGCAVVVTNLFRLRTSELHVGPVAPRAKGQLVEGMRYVGSKPAIFWTILMVAFLSVFAFSMPVFLTSFANDVYHVGAGGYGMFNALVAAGAFVGALASTRRLSIRLRTIILGAAALGVIQLVAALAPNELTFAVVLIANGFANLLFITGANSLVQMSSNVRIRGRVMSLYILVLLGGQALGGPVMGWAVEQFGPHAAMFASGALPAVAAIVIAVALARRGHLGIRVSLKRRDPFVRIVPRQQREVRVARTASRQRVPQRGRGGMMGRMRRRPSAAPGPRG